MVLVIYRYLPLFIKFTQTWWRHQMKTFSAFLAIRAGNSPVTAVCFWGRMVNIGKIMAWRPKQWWIIVSWTVFTLIQKSIPKFRLQTVGHVVPIMCTSNTTINQSSKETIYRTIIVLKKLFPWVKPILNNFHHFTSFTSSIAASQTAPTWHGYHH